MRRRTGVFIAVAAALSAGTVVVPATISSAAPPTPSIRLFTVADEATILRTERDRNLWVSLGAYLASVDGAFELQARRGAGGETEVTQVRRNGDGTVDELRQLPADEKTALERGLGRFVHVEWVDGSGAVVSKQNMRFCPNSWAASRVDDAGPMRPTYPFCGGGGLTRAAVWGIDDGWAVRAFDVAPLDNPEIPDGDYTLKLSIREKWATALEIADNTPAEISVELTTVDDGGCFKCPVPVPAARTAAAPSAAAAEDVPVGVRPDLVPLPAFDPIIEVTRKGNEYVAFAANVWNAGAGPLLVEGFRSTNTQHMPATQYFLQNGEVVAKEDVGTFDYDDRENHNHWHFEDFAIYELVSVKTGDVVKSGKQSFCLAPTDAIDMTVPGASWLTEQQDLGSACGDIESIWIRESLPSGWGDTYYQSRAGQALKITNVPNGIYDIRVTTNFEQNLVESDYSNNVSLLRIEISGQHGKDRTVTVL